MGKKQANKRRVFIVLIGIITVFVIYLVIRDDEPNIRVQSDLVNIDSVTAK